MMLWLTQTLLFSTALWTSLTGATVVQGPLNPIPGLELTEKLVHKSRRSSIYAGWIAKLQQAGLLPEVAAKVTAFVPLDSAIKTLVDNNPAVFENTTVLAQIVQYSMVNTTICPFLRKECTPWNKYTMHSYLDGRIVEAVYKDDQDLVNSPTPYFRVNGIAAHTALLQVNMHAVAVYIEGILLPPGLQLLNPIPGLELTAQIAQTPTISIYAGWIAKLQQAGLLPEAAAKVTAFAPLDSAVKAVVDNNPAVFENNTLLAQIVQYSMVDTTICPFLHAECTPVRRYQMHSYLDGRSIEAVYDEEKEDANAASVSYRINGILAHKHFIPPVAPTRSCGVPMPSTTR